MMLQSNYDIKGKKVLVLSGPSGSGKNYLENLLVTNKVNLFNKWKQYTSRPKREGEVDGYPYEFVTNEKFKELYSTLCGRIDICNKGNKYKYYYGSKPEFEDGKISTVILSAEGLEDFKNNYLKEHKDVDVFVLNLTIDESDYVDGGRNRPFSFLEKEMESLKPYATFTHKNSVNNRLNAIDVLYLLEYFNFIQPKGEVYHEPV